VRDGARAESASVDSASNGRQSAAEASEIVAYAARRTMSQCWWVNGERRYRGYPRRMNTPLYLAETFLKLSEVTICQIAGGADDWSCRAETGRITASSDLALNNSYFLPRSPDLRPPQEQSQYLRVAYSMPCMKQDKGD
jgi:hypothetical protein